MARFDAPAPSEAERLGTIGIHPLISTLLGLGPRASSAVRSACMPSAHQATLEVFPNPHPSRAYEIEHVCPEFTSVCPITGQPDFATIRIVYVPDRTCVELKSLKLYLWAFRNEGHFYEDVTNLILDDLVAVLDPLRIDVTAEFNVRGGIHSVIRASHQKPI